MMRSRCCHLGFVVMLMLALGSCVDPESGQVARSPAQRASTTAEPSGSPGVPRASPAASISGIPSYQELEGRLSVEERQVVNGFYGAFGTGAGSTPYSFKHLFDFKNPEQRDWLIRQGYPTPEEVLAAARLSDSELLAEAKAGNWKAAAFYLQRSHPSRIGEGNGNDVRAAAEQLDLLQTVLRSRSPFAGYVAAKLGESSGNPAAQLAGMALAQHLGDPRAQELIQIDGRVDAELALAELRALLAQLGGERAPPPFPMFQ